MVRVRPDVPAGHGELVLEPALARLPAMAVENARHARSWEFEVAGGSGARLRDEARRALVAEAQAWTTRLGIDADEAPQDPATIVMTGHQPDLYHTGVWVKPFLVQEVAARAGGVGIDVVVDSDTFDHVGVTAPCLLPGTERCRAYLAIGGPRSCYACAPTPRAGDIELFRSAALSALGSLPAPSIGRHFSEFCDRLGEAAPVARNLSELVTGARRRYEGDLDRSLVLSVTAASRTDAFARFAADICLSAHRFATLHNEELAAVRAAHRIRSASHPFPDLAIEEGFVEVPFWSIEAGERRPVFVREVGTGFEISTPGGSSFALPAQPDAAIAAIRGWENTLVPRALTLTLFFRTFVADLFVHGIGGARYDSVTDRIAKRWWDIDLPPFVTASLTMYLPLGAHIVTAEEVAEVDRRLHRLTHNPDEALGEVEFEGAAERERAFACAQEKRALVAAISAEGADRKTIGSRIKELNAELLGILEPLAEALRAERRRLEAQVEAGAILTDRTYPFCFWSPQEIADKIG